MRTILAIYLHTILKYTDDTSTIIFHTFTMFCYFFPLFGAMLADSFLGKFRTILYLSIVYAIGCVVISVASATGSLDLPAREVSMIGLLLISVGTGGIKPCVAAFGGDQFTLPQQEKELTQFFFLFYFAINSGSLVSTFFTPVLRHDVKCLNQTSCYPLAFGVPAVLMIVAIILFVAGSRSYIIKKSQGNIVLQVVQCICHALSRKRKLKGEKREHWLDYADDKHDKKMINDIRGALSILYLYLPLPFFWALYDQQGSRWTFQATRMNGDLGGWSIKPEQMQVVNPFLILIFIPIFETGIYPLFAKCNIFKKPLQRLGVGGLLAALTFVISAIVEIQLEPTYPVLPISGEAQIRIFNGFNYQGKVSLGNVPLGIVEPYGVLEKINYPMKGTKNVELSWVSKTSSRKEPIVITEAEATSVILNDEKNIVQTMKDKIDKSDDGYPTLRLLYSNLTENDVVKVVGKDHTETFKNLNGTSSTELVKVESSKYDVLVNNGVITQTKIDLQVGGVYTLLMVHEGSSYEARLFTITQPNSVHMLWLIPQYVVITIAEIFFSITGLEFSFTQAPISMKSVMQAAWLLTIAFGDLIVIIVAEAKFFDSQTYEFLLFAGLMVVDMVIFALMARGYKYIDPPKDDDNQDGDVAVEPTQEKSGIKN